MLLSQEINDLKVVAATSNIRDLIHEYREEVLDIVVWNIPSHHTLTPGARLLKECFPLAKILVMVTSRNSVYAGLLETLGADAVVPDDCLTSELSAVILKIHQTYAPPPSSNHVQEPDIDKKSPKLDSNENKIFLMLDRGYAPSEIASQMGISTEQVIRFSNSIKSKLGLENLPSKSSEGTGYQSHEKKTNKHRP